MGGVFAVLEAVPLLGKVLESIINNIRTKSWTDETNEYINEVKGAGEEMEPAELNKAAFERLKGQGANLDTQIDRKPILVNNVVKEDMKTLSTVCKRSVTLLPRLYQSDRFSETVEVYLDILAKIERRRDYLDEPIFEDAAAKDLQEIDIGRIIARSDLDTQDFNSEFKSTVEDSGLLSEEDVSGKDSDVTLQDLMNNSDITWRDMKEEIDWERIDKAVDKRSQRRFNRWMTRELLSTYLIQKPETLKKQINSRRKYIFYPTVSGILNRLNSNS